MHAYSRSPAGIVTHLPLEPMVWRLELAYVANVLGIGVRYVASAGPSPTTVSMLCGIDIPLEDPQIGTKVARVGFPKRNLSDDIERVSEAMKTLVNAGLRDREVDEVCAKAGPLTRAYYDIEKALRTGADAAGHFDGWDWVLTHQATGWAWQGVDEEAADG